MRVVAAAVLLLAAATATAAQAGPWRRVDDRVAGFSIAVPASWQIVPRSDERLAALAAQARAQKRTALAIQLDEVAAARKQTHTVYRFQAFAWPAPKGAVVPDVTVKTDPLTPRTTAVALPLIARQIAKSLARSGVASVPRAQVLPAGKAFEITGTIRLSKSLRTRFALYMLMHRRTLYSVSFRGPATPAESGILDGFRFR